MAGRRKPKSPPPPSVLPGTEHVQPLTPLDDALFAEGQVAGLVLAGKTQSILFHVLEPDDPLNDTGSTLYAITLISNTPGTEAEALMALGILAGPEEYKILVQTIADNQQRRQGEGA